MAQQIKDPLATQETQVQSLRWEGPLEEEMAAHSSILAGESHGQRSRVGHRPRGRRESDTAERTARAAEDVLSRALVAFLQSLKPPPGGRI